MDSLLAFLLHLLSCTGTLSLTENIHLNGELLQICTGGSYHAATAGEPGSSQIHRSSHQVQVQVWFLLKYLALALLYFLAQVTALQAG